MPHLFITATGTEVGKTHLTRALTLRLRRSLGACAALKPIETGCVPDPLDALALAAASGDLTLASDPDFYRAAPPLSPLAVTLAGAAAPLDLPRLAAAVQRRLADHPVALVEGAGGLLVPLTPEATIAELIQMLRLPVALVAPDRLGVLSDVLCAAECAAARGLDLRAVILNRTAGDVDPSHRHNRAILAERLACPVIALAHQPAPHDDGALADAVPTALLEALALT